MWFRTSWLARLLRGRRPDRNPLRHGSDRAETIVLGRAGSAGSAGKPGPGHGHAAAEGTNPERVQVNQTGRLTGPPLSGDQMSGRGLAVVLATAGWLVRRSLDRRRLCGWDAGWLANGRGGARGARACRLVTEVPSEW